jgi:cytochrome c6
MKKNTIKFIVLSLMSAVVMAILMMPASVQVAAVGNQTSGKAIYVKNCARCHGGNGSPSELGQTLDTPDLTQEKPSSGRIIGIVKNGAGSMPAFSKKLTAKQISAVAGYVRTLR